MPNLRTTRRQIKIDDGVVEIQCNRLTVDGFNQTSALSWPRGAVRPEESDERQLERINLLDNNVRAIAGIELDGVPYSGPIAKLFPARLDIISVLYNSLRSSQHLTERERRDLKIAMRFTLWLDDKTRERSSTKWAITGTDCVACRELELCDRRGCDGVDKRKTVWHDGAFFTTVCPVLSFTAEVEECIRMFFWTHDLVPVGGDWDGSK